MTHPTDTYDAYLAEFGRRLGEAGAPEPPRRPRRRLVLAAGLTAAVAVLLAVLLLDSAGDGRLDVVAEARAALPDEGELVHFRTLQTTTLIDADSEAEQRFEEFARRHADDYAPERFEQWSTDDAWRISAQSSVIKPEWFASPPVVAPHRIDRAELARIGFVSDYTGPVQQSYADHTMMLYLQELDASLVFARPDLGIEIRGPAGAAPIPGGEFVGAPTLLGSDPISYLRYALGHGYLHDAGAAEVDGHDVRRLVDDRGIIEYDVDAETFAPVRVRMFGGWTDDPDSPEADEKMAEDVTFEVFETMPLNDETEKLLEIDPVSPPTVIEGEASRTHLQRGQR